MALLSDLKVAIIAEDGANQGDIASVRERLERRAVKVSILSPRVPEIRTWDKTQWGTRIKVDQQIREDCTGEFDALILPGGKHFRLLHDNPAVRDLLNACFQSGKTIGTIGNGLLLLLSSEPLSGRKVTHLSEMRDRIESAGGKSAGEEVVCNDGLISCSGENAVETFNSLLEDELRRVAGSKSADGSVNRERPG